MKFAFPLDVPGVPIAGTGTLHPVRRIYCVGRNYAEHARETGFDPNREPPGGVDGVDEISTKIAS